MKRNCIFSIIILAVILSGCVMSSSPVATSNLIKAEKGPKVITFLTPTPYIADMSIALAEQGFLIKPMPSQQQIIEIQDPGRLAKFNEATTRWGITLQAQHIGFCAYTEFQLYNFTLMLTDIATNQMVMVLKQKGSDGPCTTVKPVFPTLAEALSNNW